MRGASPAVLPVTRRAICGPVGTHTCLLQPYQYSRASLTALPVLPCVPYCPTSTPVSPVRPLLPCQYSRASLTALPVLPCVPYCPTSTPVRPLLPCQYSRASLAVLSVGFRPTLEQQLGAVGVAQSDGVEEGRAAVTVRAVHLRAAQGDERVDTVGVAATGGAVQRCRRRQVRSGQVTVGQVGTHRAGGQGRRVQSIPEQCGVGRCRLRME